jgi:hypothetical protein
MATPQWVKKLGGHAGELYVAAELSKRGIPNALLPENFSDDDILAGNKSGSEICYIQVKACHPNRSKSFPLYERHEAWADAPENQFVVFVWLGSPAKNEGPRYWIASKREVGKACIEQPTHGTPNRERRFYLGLLEEKKTTAGVPWRDNWAVFDKLRTAHDSASSKRGEAAKARTVRRIAKLAAKIAELKKVAGGQS